MTADEFLEWHERQELSYEYEDGFPVLRDPVPDPRDPTRMMTGATREHRRVVINIATALHPQAQRSGCRVDASDGAVWTVEDRFRYPDVMVSCGPEPEDRFKEWPSVIFEVISPGSALKDATVKRAEYEHVPTLNLYVLVDPMRVHVVLYERGEMEWSISSLTTMDDRVEVTDPPLSLSLAEIYEGLNPMPSHPTVNQRN